jgi:pimeloyl-ACP methyl ester carboxylesterase
MKTSHSIPSGKYRINATSVGDSGTAIIFIHGNSQTSEGWDLQMYAPELNSKYKLIAFDLPGHGQSDWLKGDDTSLYDLKEITKIVEAVIDFYNPERYILVGLSYGTNLIAEMTNPLPGCRGIVLAGAHILATGTDIGQVLKTLDVPPVTAMPEVADEDLKKFCRYLSNDPEIGQGYFNSYKKTDPVFRDAVAKVIIGKEWSDEPLNLARHDIPVMVVYGEEEALIFTEHLEKYKSVWQPTIIFVENAGHLVNQEKPQEFNRLLLDFAEGAFK